MSEVGKMKPPQLFTTAPAPVSNGSSFYVFFGSELVTGEKCLMMTYYVNGSWGSTLIAGKSGALLPNCPAPQLNSKILSILVGDVVCAVYPSNNAELVVLTSTSASTWEKRTTYVSSLGISDFSLFTDGSNLFIILNENGVVSYIRLDNSQWDNNVVISGSESVSQGAPTADSNTLVCAAFNGESIHCIYDSASGLTDVYQIGANNYTHVTVVSGQTSTKSLELFNYNGDFYLMDVNKHSEVTISQFNSLSGTKWSSVFVTPTSAPAVSSSSSASVLSLSYGAFVCYSDSNGNLQLVFNFPGYSWSNLQLTGNGALSSMAPLAPSATNPPALASYAGWIIHACYGTSNTFIEDVFWAGSWNYTQLFPNPPSSSDELGEAHTKKKIEEFKNSLLLSLKAEQ